jgi:HlyD family secretion protein
LGSLDCVAVRRDNLDTRLLAGGDLHAVKETVVKCEVEDVTDSGGTMILSLIENGTVVKEGDELCRLDSSALEELARQQEIFVNQARAATLKAGLTLETAEIGLREYQDGLAAQLTKEFQGRIALGRSDMQRQTDRLTWTGDMVVKGYLSRGQLLSEQQLDARVRHENSKTEGEFRLFREFTVPKELKTRLNQIKEAEINHRIEADRLKSEEDELIYLQAQIGHCIIRAPKAGVVIHSNGGRWWAIPIQAGMRAVQNQQIFQLPDLSRMEVLVSLHESMGPRVHVGMKADVKIASMGERVFTGQVTAMDMFPSPNWKEWDPDLKHFFVHVRLDKTPASALPFMSATVTFHTGRVTDALVIPVEAMTIVSGRQSCYVVSASDVECRSITTRRATADSLEVISGLDEGERVLWRPHEWEASRREWVEGNSPE